MLPDGSNMRSDRYHRLIDPAAGVMLVLPSLKNASDHGNDDLQTVRQIGRLANVGLDSP
jgi:hypothetical protein